MKALALGIGMWLLAASALAQNSTFYGLIPSIFHKGTLSKRFDYNVFLSTTLIPFRTHWHGVDYLAGDRELYVQPSLVYKASPALNLSVGYTYLRSNPFNGEHENENRYWQQLTYELPLWKAAMTHRLRFDQGLQQTDSEQRQWTTRLNYQLGLEIPLQGRSLDGKEFYLASFNESFFSLSKSAPAFVSENWTYLGLGYQTAKTGKFEIGPLVQLSVTNSNRDIRSLVLMQLLWITPALHQRSVKSN